MPDKTWYGLLATFFGLGRTKRMPGTVGSAAGLLILAAFGGVNIIALAVTILIGTIASDRYAREKGVSDPQEVVIDEVAGYWTSMLGLDVSSAIMAFFLFRVIDIVKPFPVDSAEKLPGGVGIMADDVCGGLIVNLFLRFISWFILKDGFEVLRYLGAAA
jgi:phosphatidylglycerophosphatase A